MSRVLCFALSVCLLSVTSAGTAIAQGDAMLELYGAGVHKYFAGDYAAADQLLSQVVDSGSLDPRAHYFRGLVREMQGGGGQFDFENGARLEAEGKRAVGVGVALTRVQGAVRSQIEKARRDARVQLRQQQLMMEEARRNAASSGEGTMGSATMPTPSGETVPPVPSETNDPFAGEGLRSSETTVDPAQPSEPEVDAVTDPFGNDAPAMEPPAAAEPAPAGGDPFGTEPATPAGDDPFGSPAGDDPFGGSAPAGGADDPFGTGL